MVNTLLTSILGRDYYDWNYTKKRVSPNPTEDRAQKIKDELYNTQTYVCPECSEQARICSGCLGHVCSNGHLSKKSTEFTPCSKHIILDCANITEHVEEYKQKPSSWFDRMFRCCVKKVSKDI